jgi:hypothetical protein
MISNFLRQTVLLTLAVPCLTASTATIAAATDRGPESGGSYAIGLWGDLPYNDVQAQVGVPNLIADMNRQNLAFTVFDGDWKAGSGTTNSVTPTTCSDALYTQSLGYLNSLKAPAAVTPGDNDWVDCDRAANGGFNSLERLQRQREIFFSTPYTAGKRKLKQEVQATYVENRRWKMRGVTYVTLNVQGSCNNLCDTNPDPAEYKARNAANIAWLKESFAQAKANQSVAIMIISQGNPGWDLSDGTRAALRDPKTLAEIDPTSLTPGPQKPVPAGLDGFQEYLLALRSEVVAFLSTGQKIDGL